MESGLMSVTGDNFGGGMDTEDFCGKCDLRWEKCQCEDRDERLADFDDDDDDWDDWMYDDFDEEDDHE